MHRKHLRGGSLYGLTGVHSHSVTPRGSRGVEKVRRYILSPIFLTAVTGCFWSSRVIRSSLSRLGGTCDTTPLTAVTQGAGTSTFTGVFWTIASPSRFRYWSSVFTYTLRRPPPIR